VFLWGWLLAGGGLSAAVLLAFVSFHLFLYGGVTAYNSYYDRDVGPVGGLEHPPPATNTLLPFSLAIQAAGWLLALFVNALFAVAYAIFVMLSVAYSHPRIRLKAHPLRSLVVVGLGQGALAFLAAWAAVRGEIGSAATPEGALGALTAVLLILALYPLTQLYQIDEDRARGDRTLAVAWGPSRCFVFSLVCTVLGGAAMLTILAHRFGLLDAVLVTIGIVLQVAAVLWLRKNLKVEHVVATYRAVMRLNTASAAALGGYLLTRLALTF
jgi:1,4-dihydroxy-2-naphthoate octaprenyltransferase